MNLSDQLAGILSDIQGVWTESTLIVGAILILIVGLIKSDKWLIKSVYLGVLLAAFYLKITNQVTGNLMMDSLRSTAIASSFGSLFILVGILLLVFKRSSKHQVEYCFLIVAMLAGSLFMMKANSLLIIYLSIELVSLTSYILTNFSFKKTSFEAGIKYLLFGAISSAVMLFGIGIIYGTTGTFYLSEWGVNTFENLLPQVGFVLMLIGIFFKISIAPSHLWVPSTYQAAPADATAFMSIVPKLAGLILLRQIFQENVFESSHWVSQVVLFLGILTIIAGTLGAFQQSNARRMVSFGAIAHSGFLLPFALMNNSMLDALWFYAVIYAIMNLIVFYLLDRYERSEVHEIDDYSSTSKEVWLGSAFTIVLVSLVGLPPLAGFTSKFFLFTSLWQSHLAASNDYFLWYLIVAVLATVGSLFFYLKIPRQIFLSQSEDNRSINFNFSTKIIATLFCIALLLLFFVPQLVMEAQHMLNNVHE
jgi:NADH-quinone oxidoreductase subunit N